MEAFADSADYTAIYDTDMDAARLDALMHAPVVRCDTAQWTLFGISLAGFNAILSLGGAMLILWCMRKAR